MCFHPRYGAKPFVCIPTAFEQPMNSVVTRAFGFGTLIKKDQLEDLPDMVEHLRANYAQYKSKVESARTILMGAEHVKIDA